LRQYYHPNHSISLHLLHYRISAKRSFWSLQFILHLSRVLLFGAHSKQFSDCILFLFQRYSSTLGSYLVCSSCYSMWLVHTFSTYLLSSYSWESKAKRL